MSLPKVPIITSRKPSPPPDESISPKMVDFLKTSGRCRSGRLAVCFGIAAALASCAASHAQSDVALEQTASRVIHRFDFTEPNNFDTIPSYWVRFPDPAFPDPEFPRYTEASFDPDVGHDAPPSFYLESRGRCVAYRYDGPATRIRPGDYLVVGWIKPDRMNDSRAAISAYYLDWEGRFIGSTQVYSPLVGPTADDDWQRVQVYLPKAPEDAQFIGVTCWIVQQNVWRAGVAPHRHINHRDVTGGAWFDDIAVLGLPHAVIESAHPGNVAHSPERFRLLATVTDDTTAGLDASVTVRDRSGQEVYRSNVAPHTYDDEEAEVVTLPPLAPGLYHAVLDVYSDAQPLLQQTLTFAVVHESHQPRGFVAQAMGIVFDGASAKGVEDELALVQSSEAGAVKLTLWSGDPRNPGYDVHRGALHDLLDQMIESRIAVIGVLAGPPAEMVRTVGVYARSLLDILTDDPQGWRLHLDAVVAPYASILASWQIGGDGDVAFINDKRVAQGVQAVRTTMQSMITAPHLTTVASAGDMPPEDLPPSNNLSIELPPDITPAYVADHIEPYRALGYERLWVTVPLGQSIAYDEDAALGEWALRIIEARWSGADTVFVRQPWTFRETLYGSVVEPTAALIVYRTIVDAIGDATPSTRMDIGDGAQALAFNNGSTVTLVMWDPQAPAEGTEHDLQLGAASDAMDMWGNSVTIERTGDGRHRIHLSAKPVYVLGIEPWLVAFRAGVTLTPRETDFAVEARRHELTLSNPYHKPISGEIVVRTPEGWDIEPRRIQFSLDAEGSSAFPVYIRHPHNESAGVKTLHAEINLVSDNKYALDIPLQIELGVHDLDVWGYAVSDGDGIVVYHGVTNRSSKPLSFQAFAVFPGMSRQYRSINELLPGQSLSVEYRFADVTPGSGKRIRLGLIEVNGPRIHNMDVDSP